jgi:hypothetical protein
MKIEKMSLRNIKDILSRSEMKVIMAGSGGGSCPSCFVNGASMGCYTQTVGSKTGCRCGLVGSTTNPKFWC